MTTERSPHARPAQSTEHAKGAKVMLSLPSTPSRQSTPSLRLSTSVKRTSEFALLKVHSYNISNHTSTTTTSTTTTPTTTTTTTTPGGTSTSAELTGTGGNTVSQEQLSKEFYRSYNPSTGLHTAAVLGSILVWLVLYLIYRTKVRRCILRAKRRFEGETSLSSSSFNTNNNTNWNNKNNNGIEERPVSGEEDLYACTSDGGQGSVGKKPLQNTTEFSDSLSNSGTGTGTNPNMTRSAFVNPSIVIETSPTDSLPLSPGVYNNSTFNNGYQFPCSVSSYQRDTGYCRGDNHTDMIFQFPCVDNNCQGHCDFHDNNRNPRCDDQGLITATSRCEQGQCYKEHYPCDDFDYHHHNYQYRDHHCYPQQEEAHCQPCPQQLPKSVLDIPSATARWVQTMPLAMRSFQDLTNGPGGFGAFRFGGLHQSTLGPMGPVYKPCSCPMVCPPSPQQPMQLLQPSFYNNSMPVLPSPISQRLEGGASFLEFGLDGIPLFCRQNENDNVMNMVNAKRRKMKRRKDRKSKTLGEDKGKISRRRSSSRDYREPNSVTSRGYSGQSRRHTMCVADASGDQNTQDVRGDIHAMAGARSKAPSNLTISIPKNNNCTHKDTSSSISVDGSNNNSRRSPVPLPVTPTVTIQNSCGPSYHHRRHTSIASVSSSSSDLMVLPVPLPVACPQPVPSPPRLPSPHLLSSPNPVPSSPCRLSSSPSHRKSSTSKRIPSPHLLHPTSEGGAKIKGKPRSPLPGRARSCSPAPSKAFATDMMAPLSPSPSHGSQAEHRVRSSCSFSFNTKESENSRMQNNCSFKLTRHRQSSSSSSKHSGSETCRHLPRSGSGLSGESRPRGCPIRRFHCSPSEGHLASIASQAASPSIDRQELRSFSGGMYRNRRCLSDLYCNTNTELSPTSPIAFDGASCSLSPTSSLPSSRHRCSQLQQQRSISAAEMLTSSSRRGRDEGGASPTWSNPSTRTSQGGGASSYSHSPSPHLLQVPDYPTMLRPITPDNSLNFFNNNGSFNGGENQPNTRCRQQHQHSHGASMNAAHTQMRHSVLSDSNLAYYKSQLYLDDDCDGSGKKSETDPNVRRNSTFTHSTGKINLSYCEGFGSVAGECGSVTANMLRPSSSCGSSSSYGSSLHPHNQHPTLQHHACCRHEQPHELHQQQGDASDPSSTAHIMSCSASQELHNRRHNNRHHHSTGLLSPTDNQNLRINCDRLSASSHNINTHNLNPSHQNINKSLSACVMETKL
ncbi:hypothetical protein ElyMa_001620300 [Elysia marginata]|uniref:Uncharacterized protein n=1 Tax=Elysia marginata TaxID=1093978 RepID=A0AAV4JPV0_9GAST|nr:hypothetical protein ElyMa_001620300 [Elysia marginata]